MFFILKLVMILGMALLFAALETPISYTHGEIFAAAYIACLADVAAGTVEYVIRLIKKPRKAENNGGEKNISNPGLLGVLYVVFCLVIIIYGMTNYSRIVVKRHEWTAEGITRAYTFAFASDLHAEDPQSIGRIREFCRQVNAANPEFVVLGGDITDELTTYDENGYA